MAEAFLVAFNIVFVTFVFVFVCTFIVENKIVIFFLIFLCHLCFSMNELCLSVSSCVFLLC